MEVGFIGLGGMGAGMARNLVKAGHAVTVWNRTRARAEPLATEGASVAATPREAARTITITMLADDAATEAATLGPDGLLAGLPPGGVHVAMGTIGVDAAKRLAALHEEAGRGYLAAPVFGRPDAAAAAKLFVIAAGAEARVEAVRPVLEAMGQRVFVVGERPEQANLVKLAGNYLITCVLQGLGETTALVGKAGVDPKAFLDLLTSTLFSGPVYKTYGGLIAERSFTPPGFALPLGLKDNRLLLRAAEKLRVPLPLASVIRDQILAALARGREGQDWSSFAMVAAENAGLGDGGRR